MKIVLDILISTTFDDEFLQRSELREMENLQQWPETTYSKFDNIQLDIPSYNSIVSKNNRKPPTRKKVQQNNVFRARTFNFKERVEKRNNLNNNYCEYRCETKVKMFLKHYTTSLPNCLII